MQNVEIFIDNDVDSWEWLVGEFNRYFNFKPNTTWECGSGCSIQNIFTDGVAQKIKEDLDRKHRLGQWRISKVKIEQADDSATPIHPIPN